MEKHELTQLEARIKSVQTSHTALSNSLSLNELLNIIHRPGWTTPAELAFVNAGLDSIDAQIKQLNTLTQGLINSAKLVGTGRAAGA
jgi:hypothetical protein